MVWYLKFLVLVAGTFGISWLIYEIIIRRFSVFRFLFGMKSKDAKPVTISADGPIL
jgi:hypothetical protein